MPRLETPFLYFKTNLSFQEVQTDEEEEEEEEEGEEDEEGKGEDKVDRAEKKGRGTAQLCARFRATAQRFLHNMGRVLAITLLGLAGEKQHTQTLKQGAHLHAHRVIIYLYTIR